MKPCEKLLDFFRGEFLAEEKSGFSRLSRVPNVDVKDLLAYYKSLSKSDRLAYIDCAAHWAHACFGFVIGAPEIDNMSHPYYKPWSHALGDYHNRTHYAQSQMSVPKLRARIQQYKIDLRKGIQSRISIEDFQYASSIKSVKAPELRKRMREALRPIGYYKKDKFGYCCRRNNHEFRVRINYGGARFRFQLGYGVVRSKFDLKRSFSFERALGFVTGNCWNFIVEENVDDAISLLTDLVTYSFELPERIREAAL